MFTRNFADQHRDRAKRARAGQVVVVTGMMSRVHVASPLNQVFLTRAKELGGRWKYRSKVWSFPLSTLPELWPLLAMCYGLEAAEHARKVFVGER